MEEDAQYQELTTVQTSALPFIQNTVITEVKLLFIYGLGDPASLTVMVQVNMNNICLMAIWVSEEPIHSGPHAHPGQRQEMRPQRRAGSLGWVLHPQQTCPSWPCTPRTTLWGCVGLHRYVQVAHKVASSSSCSLSTDGDAPRAEDYFWPAGSRCCCLSQLRWAMALCCQPQERVLLLRRTSGSPHCQHGAALCPVTGKDKLQQCNTRPPSSREHQKP